MQWQLCAACLAHAHVRRSEALTAGSESGSIWLGGVLYLAQEKGALGRAPDGPALF